MQGPNEQRSLLGEVLDWMLAPLLLLWPMSVAVTWFVAQGIANRPYDRDLGDIARALSSEVGITAAADPASLPQVRFQLPQAAEALLRIDDEDRRFYQVLGARGEFLGGDFDLPVPDDGLPPTRALRYRDETVHGIPVRVAYLWLSSPGREGDHAALVQVASTLNKRSKLATEIIKGVILPQFVILPLAVVLVWLALWRGIAPLSRLQERIRRRDSTDLSPIAERDVPDEVAPLVRSINELLARLDRSMSAQKHFLADAAHQMKTPLAGLRTQAELAMRETDPKQLQRSLAQLVRSASRTAHLVSQLLSLARTENLRDAAAMEPLDLCPLVRAVAAEWVDQALERRIDFGVENDAGTAPISGHPILLREMINNLIDNALRYTPERGMVTVRTFGTPEEVVLEVEDDGSGVPVAEREMIFERFYRMPGAPGDGSGLGLPIVREIAAQHGARIEIDDGIPWPAARGGGAGTRVCVRFPRLAD